MKRLVAVSINWKLSPLRILSVSMLSFCFAATAVGQCSGLSFNAAINIEAGTPQHLAAGDFNGDGKTDLVFPAAADTVSVFMGTAKGLPVRLPLSVQAPRDVGVGDFNHDGKLDLVVTRTPAFNQSFLTIFLGDGSGGFGAPTDFAGTFVTPVVVADFNNDNNLDVFLGTGSSGSSQILLGNGSGGFAAPVVANVAGSASAVAGDFNNDGKIDLVLGSPSGGPNSVSLALGNGNGGFSSSKSFPASRPAYVSAADFNSDGKLDVVAAGQNDGVSVLLGDGAGNLGAATSFSTGSSTNTVIAGDFNGDGKADVLATGGILISLFTGDGNGNLTGRKEYRVSHVPLAVATGDLNGDGALDVFFADQNPTVPKPNGTLLALGGTVMFGDGAGNMHSANLISGASTLAVASGDLNGDGRPDLVSISAGVAVSLATSSGFSAPTNVTVGSGARSISLADLDGDQKLDLVTANFDGNSLSVRFGDGFGGFGVLNNLPLPGFGPQSVTTGDFNQDGNPDLIVAYLNSNFVAVLPGNGAGGFGTAVTSATTSGAVQLAVGDFNGDGKPDIALGAISGLLILLGNGNGGFGAATTFATTSTVRGTAVGDFNGDGNADVAATVGNNNELRIYSGNGQGGFTLSTTLSTAGGPTGVALADYNGDGTVDVATGNDDGTTSVFLGNGNATFAPAFTYPVGGGPAERLIATDFDLDGRPDLAFASQGNPASAQPSSLSIIYNVCSMVPAALPTLSVSDVSVTEGDTGTANATFNVTLSAASNKTVSVSFYSANLDAAKTVDYQNALGRLTFAPGATTQTITIPIVGDTLDEFDEQFNVILSYPLNATLAKPRGLGIIIDNDPTPTISINDVLLVEGNSGPATATFALTLSAVSGRPVTVQFATQDGTANAGSDYVQKSTSVVLQPGTVSTTATVAINGDTAIEPDETFFVNLTAPINVTITQAQAKCIIIADDSAGGNPIDLAGFFVRQNYRDFLGREPDISGFEFWRDQIASCNSDAQCTEVRRINVSAAFFLSIEFQQTGNLVYKMYKAGFGNLQGKPVAVDRAPFLSDTRQIQSTPVQVIVNQGNWQAQLETNKQAFALAFVQRSAFQSAHSAQLADAYVNSLFTNTGASPTAAETSAAVAAFNTAGGGDAGRAAGLRSVAESTSVAAKVNNEAFVLMQYFGYLQRNPYDPPEPTRDYAGYNFWLDKLNQFNGDFIAAEMVKAFISSTEYRQRFGP